MLLRSSSTPAVPMLSRSESLEPELSIGRCKSVQLSSGGWDFVGEIQRRFRGGRRNAAVVVDSLESEKASISGRKSDNFGSAEADISSSGDGGRPVYMGAGFGIGEGGGMSGGGRGGRRGGGGGGESSGADSHATDTYYQKMLEANPGNPLLLRNYAKFLHEVQHNLGKAEEYYERAILANPGDGEVLSLYAKLIWEAHKDAPRAEDYFDQAVQTAPDDCYVLASYAHFLWNSEDGEVGEEGAELQHNVSRPTFHESASAEAL